MARTNTEIQSTLLKYDTQPSKDFPEYLLVRCPKEDCPSHTKDGVRPFLVHKRTWIRPLKSKHKGGVTFTTRACPYCFRPSRHK